MSKSLPFGGDFAYNTNMAESAITSGGALGKGFLEGTRTKGSFIPEQHTDYIFTTIGEEWGFVGTATVELVDTDDSFSSPVVGITVESDGVVDSAKQAFYALRLWKHSKINPFELVVPQKPVNGIDGVRRLMKAAEEVSK